MLAIGVMIWLGSELMFFSGLFAAFFTIRANAPWGSGPRRAPHLDTIRAAIFTLVLVVVQLHHAVGRLPGRMARPPSARDLGRRDHHPGHGLPGQPGPEWLFLTTRWYTNSYGSLFFIMSGLHGLHVFIGLVAMVFLLGRMQGDMGGDPGELSAIQGISYYWHFVDIVWIGLFSCLFLLK